MSAFMNMYNKWNLTISLENEQKDRRSVGESRQISGGVTVVLELKCWITKSNCCHTITFTFGLTPS